MIKSLNWELSKEVEELYVKFNELFAKYEFNEPKFNDLVKIISLIIKRIDEIEYWQRVHEDDHTEEYLGEDI